MLVAEAQLVEQSETPTITTATTNITVSDIVSLSIQPDAADIVNVSIAVRETQTTNAAADAQRRKESIIHEGGIVERFLNSSATQLTPAGLVMLHQQVRALISYNI